MMDGNAYSEGINWRSTGRRAWAGLHYEFTRLVRRRLAVIRACMICHEHYT
jgi:hypothetical protein